MNIALVHDQLVNYGGAEGVFLTLSKMYPKADIYTSFFDEKNPSYFSISDRIIKKISLPKSFRYSTLGKLIVNAYWQSLDLTKYDLVITSSDTFSCHSVITGPETTHVAYIHTPPRYLYAEDPNYYEIGRTSFIRNIIISYLRNCDKIASQRPDVIVVPSDTVKKRVLKYYRIKPLVIPCPISTAAGIKRERTQDAYLLLGRIETHKGVELVVNAFARSKKKLLIAGIGKEYKKLVRHSINYPNIKFLGWVSDDAKSKLLAKAKALIIASKDEDFGITTVEALKNGTPVIAYYSGNMRNVIQDGKNGYHYYQYTPDALNNSVEMLEKKPLKYKTITSSVNKYSEKRFISSFSSLISKYQH